MVSDVYTPFLTAIMGLNRDGLIAVDLGDLPRKFKHISNGTFIMPRKQC